MVFQSCFLTKTLEFPNHQENQFSEVNWNLRATIVPAYIQVESLQLLLKMMNIEFIVLLRHSSLDIFSNTWSQRKYPMTVMKDKRDQWSCSFRLWLLYVIFSSYVLSYHHVLKYHLLISEDRSDSRAIYNKEGNVLGFIRHVHV